MRRLNNASTHVVRNIPTLLVQLIPYLVRITIYEQITNYCYQNNAKKWDNAANYYSVLSTIIVLRIIIILILLLHTLWKHVKKLMNLCFTDTKMILRAIVNVPVEFLIFNVRQFENVFSPRYAMSVRISDDFIEKFELFQAQIIRVKLILMLELLLNQRMKQNCLILI